MITYHFTEEQLRKVLAEAIGMFVEELCREGGHVTYGKRDMSDKEEPKWTREHLTLKSVQEMIEGLDAEQELFKQGEINRPGQIVILEGGYAYPIIESVIALQGD